MFEKVYLWVHMYEYRCVRVWVCACVQTAFHAEQHATVEQSELLQVRSSAFLLLTILHA